jgi:hypothetical protein
MLRCSRWRGSSRTWSLSAVLALPRIFLAYGTSVSSVMVLLFGTMTLLVAFELGAPGAPSLVLLIDWAERREVWSLDLRVGSGVDGIRRDV